MWSYPTEYLLFSFEFFTSFFVFFVCFFPSNSFIVRVSLGLGLRLFSIKLHFIKQWIHHILVEQVAKKKFRGSETRHEFESRSNQLFELTLALIVKFSIYDTLIVFRVLSRLLLNFQFFKASIKVTQFWMKYREVGNVPSCVHQHYKVICLIQAFPLYFCPLLYNICSLPA